MAGGGNPVRAILYAFGANLGIALAKLAAWAFTGSSSLLAEAIHSFADTTNQLLLLYGTHRARRPPDARHPLGYGKALYVWSFIVAMLLFSVGGLFSIWEGWHRLHEPPALGSAWVGVAVLGIAVVLEASSLYGCLREIAHLRRERSLREWLLHAHNAELVVVFGEDVAALAGLACALVALVLAMVTGDARFDAAGSIAIGVLLVVVAVAVAVRIKSLLIGRSADPEVMAEIERAIAGDDAIRSVFNIISLQFGPQLMLAAKLRFADGLSIGDAARRINALEARLKRRFPEIGWCFIEPDVTD